ncbi:hypothetical protein ACFHW0_04925, partial [Micromonospora sp. LOL_025]
GAVGVAVLGAVMRADDPEAAAATVTAAAATAAAATAAAATAAAATASRPASAASAQVRPELPSATTEEER